MKSDAGAERHPHLARGTLPDYLANNLRIISVGLNPSPNSVRCAYPYATVQNRFWRALNRSTLVAQEYPPCVQSMLRLCEVERIGFTDVVKRPTPGAADLRAADFRYWAPLTLEKLERLRPRVVWFQGKMTYRNFARYALGSSPPGIDWGLQSEQRCAGAYVFVTPNPSAANAAFSLDDITRWMDRLAAFVRESADC